MMKLSFIVLMIACQQDRHQILFYQTGRTVGITPVDENMLSCTSYSPNYYRTNNVLYSAIGRDTIPFRVFIRHQFCSRLHYKLVARGTVKTSRELQNLGVLHHPSLL